jgi:hypothetical protein
VAAGLTLVLVDIYFWTSFFGPAAERDMATLAHAINANFQREQAAALSTLNTMNKSSTAAKLSEAPRKGDIRVLYSSSKETCNPNWACKTNILQGDRSLDIDTYPYLLYAFWSDQKGKQQIKWTTRRALLHSSLWTTLRFRTIRLETALKASRILAVPTQE